MFENPRVARMRQSFADQFQPEGSGFVFRKSFKGAPIIVTAAERDRFVADFNRNLRWAIWGSMAAMVALVLALVAFTVMTDKTPSDLWLYVPVVLLAGGLTAAVMAIWNAPARALARRSPVGAPLSREEARRAALTRITWGQVLGGVFALPLLALQLSRYYDLLHGWGRLWLVVIAALAAVLLFAVYRKWRYGRG
jgi:hypothetical protein